MRFTNQTGTGGYGIGRRAVRYVIKKRACYLFLLPFFSLFCVFTVLPVLSAMGLSLTYFNVLEPPQWVGIKNFTQLFFYDEIFLKALVNTLTMALFIGPIGYLIALLVAWMINELRPAVRTVLVILMYAPSISGNLYMIWNYLLNGDAYGYVNSLLLSVGLIQEPIQWLTDTQYMMGSVIVVSLWTSLGTSFLSFVAGLQGVDPSLYEAGAIDGIRNRWQELWYVTLPAMKPQLLFGAVMSITGAFSTGEIGANLCGNPSTDYAVHTVMNHLNDYGGVRFEMGYACAIASFLFLLMVGSNQLVQRLLRKVGS